MFTKTDLLQLAKLVRKVLREEIGNETQALKDDLQADINMSRIRVQNDISELKDRIKNLEIRLTTVHKDLKKEIKMVSYVLDKENMQTLKRVKRLEEHLELSVQ